MHFVVIATERTACGQSLENQELTLLEPQTDCYFCRKALEATRPYPDLAPSAVMWRDKCAPSPT